MKRLLHDFRYGLRTLRKRPGFAVAAVLTLALGIGANTAIFSFISGVLLRPLPFPAAGRLVSVGESNPEKSRRMSSVSPRNLEDWERRSQTVERFGAFRDWHFREATPEGRKGVWSGIATPGFFDVLGVKPELGRTFLPEENERGRDHVILLGHDFWQSRFGGDPSVVGKTMTLDDESYTVVGVLPREIEEAGTDFDVWAPVSVDPDQYLERYHRNRQVLARLRPGVRVEQARAEMNQIARQLAEEYPKDNAGWTVTVNSLLEQQTGSVRTPLLVLQGAVGLMLLIACANVAGLMLVRAAARRKEFAVRAALGAGRLRLMRQLVVEGVPLALAGGAAGLLLAFWLVDLFKGLAANTPRLEDVRLDGWVFAFTLVVSLLTGFLFALAPGLQSSRVNLVEALKEGGRGQTAGGGARLRGWLVVSQIALACVLLVGAGLLARTFVQLVTLRPGFNPQNLLTVQLFLPNDKYKKDQLADFYRRVTAEFEAMPGVESVGASSSGPQFGGFETIDVLAEGQSAPPSGDYPQARYQDIGPGYFATMQIPLLAGREFADSDTASAPPVAVINETLARKFFPGENPVGKRLLLPRDKEELEVVGVAGDVRRYGLGEAVEPEIYWPYMQQPRWANYFVLRTHADPTAVTSAARRRVAALDGDVSVSNAATMDKLISKALTRPRFNLILLGLFAATALVLAALGLYGVISYDTARRTHEIGIRVALGAEARDVLALVLRQGMTVALAGIGLGLLASLALTRLAASLLYGVSATDPLTFASIASLLAAIALLASYLPARRATKVDPIVALRYE
jgi:putative ABC transport system permease protein